MRPSIFLHLKKGLICTAMLSTFALSGCQIVSEYFPSTQKTPEQSTSDDASRYQAIIDAAQGKPSMEAIRAYISQEPLLKTAAERQANIDGLWQMLTQLTPEQIHGIGADENILQGWVDLLDIYQNNRDDTDALLAGYNDWKMRYSNNPGVMTTPTLLQQAMIPQVGKNPKIALFLPMSGQGQVFGQAIMQGFMDAQKGLPQGPATQTAITPPPSSGNDVLDQIYEQVAATTGNAPTSSDSDVVTSTLRIDAAPVNTQSVKVFDTTNKQMPELIEQAKNEGFNLIVGPLLKSDVQVITQMGAPVSVLALNELDANQLQPRPNLCYFSLSPEDEAQNAAAYMKAEGKQMPLVLVPANAFGDRIAKAFAQGWQEKGGGTVLMQTFGSVPSLKESINRGAGIRMTGTPVNTGIQSIDSQYVDSAGAIDGVYIVATRDELTLIKPMIEMAISSRSRPSLYASSRSNQAGSGADYRFEMDGVKFSEIPLLAGANNNLRKQAQQKLNNDYSLFRLYAMGIDAWSLANNYDKLQQSGQFRINGASGTLSTTPNCVVFRELPWLQFKQGKVVSSQ
ncbi:penicillin-binding protein activator [Providencia hangzhouensis]|uniref:Lipoprotein activator of PBP from the outer membrane A n=1 Tax=Providencia rettgeri TaxID=587 RepID=A0A264VUA4_PRORE|nr:MULTISPECIES: penicillin-binding protein activator [Providencia]MBN7842577.1 penicillin-binding protein activator [Providencia rettgeri]MBN7852805.1 penicillin-binding protein activator [Providencia rettgeri]MBN7863348.1 penicillin-binding protein activator [Providencia rettgeri]MBN7871333.1 penicillin-binding protein activator [Providencia rettgeri]MBN7895741.1 penicillin-binding protein activator [Providencia rettgeri]